MDEKTLRSIQDKIDLANRTADRVKALIPETPLGITAASLKAMQAASDPRSGEYASDFRERLLEMIGGFEAGLDQEHEIGARVVSFGAAVVIHLAGVGFYNPSLIRFFGETESGDPVELIQHVSQISVMLVSLKKQGEAPRRIGFHSEE